MKQFYTLIAFLITGSVAFAQIPANYYDSANGLTGYALKTELRNITANGHTARTYDQLYDGDGVSGSQGYIDTHSDVNVTGGTNYENDGTILDFYSENPSGNDPYNYTHGNNQCGNQNSEGDCYNREHLVPQSSFGSAFPMQSDIHHVIPSDGRVNNFRGSLPFGNVATPNWTSLNGSQRGSSAMMGYSGTVFEPIDEFKGDIARALLYFATRYENTVDGYTSFDMFNGTEDQVFYTWAIEVLLDWHYNVDPVDDRERARNHEAYNFQGNANPFVDHPEYANMIWNPVADTEAPTAPTNLIASNPTLNSVDLTWNASTDNVAVVSYDIYVDGNLTYNTTGTSYTANGLASDTNFCFTVYARDGSNNVSPSSNQACETTLEGTGTPNELFISEYVEGSSTNKAIEIANFTGNSVNLSVYSVARNTNSGASWGPALSLTGTVANEDVYVIARGNADPDILAVADQLSSQDAMLFNGDDPVGLFKDGTLIDIFGNFNGSNSFSNVTYRRKSTVSQPTTAFDLTGEWDSYPNNTFDGLGSHNQTLSTPQFDLNSISFYPNPVKRNTVFFNTNETINVKVYDILGKLVLQESISSNNTGLNVSNLNKGMYLVNITLGNQTMTKKLIKN